jgi:hypothetical protein
LFSRSIRMACCGCGPCDGDAAEGRVAEQGVRGLRAAVCLAEEMGAGLGAGQVLQRAVQGETAGGAVGCLEVVGGAPTLRG